jgi:hypothetical protein
MGYAGVSPIFQAAKHLHDPNERFGLALRLSARHFDRIDLHPAVEAYSTYLASRQKRP